MEKQSRVVYQIPCRSGQVYIRETIRQLEARLKEHWNACERGTLENSTVAEHVWERHHPINWEETIVLIHARQHKEVVLKKALYVYIQKIPVEDRLHCDAGLELPNCWMTTLRRLTVCVEAGQPQIDL